jgi:hypothetical protein
MARHNQNNGRHIDSEIDVACYCPPEVFQLSGPLFGDLEGISDKFDSFLASRMAQTKFSFDKCTTCGLHLLWLGVWMDRMCK